MTYSYNSNSLKNEGLHGLYGSPNIVGVIKSIRLRWVGHVGIMEEDRSAFKILRGKLTGSRLRSMNFFRT
jgi:hypothetical protein